MISVLIVLLAAAVGGAYAYIQYQLNQLPVENLNYRITGVGYKHIRLAEVSFTYIEPSREVDALSSGFRSGAATLEAPVTINDVFVTWQWHGFSPDVQIVEVGHLDATLSHWPAAWQQSSSDNGAASWRIPDDWRVAAEFPHQLDIKAFIVDLPCADRCYYSGSMGFTSENKARLLSADEPQRTQLNLSISPYQQFHDMQQLNLYLDYRVAGDVPELAMVLQSPMALNLESTQRLDHTNRLHGDLQVRLEPSAHWIFDELWKWQPQLQAQSEPVLSFLSDSLSIDVTYESDLPETSLERWVNEINAQLEADIELQDQLFVSINSQLYRDDHITFDGSLDAAFAPSLRANLRPLLGSPELDPESPFHPSALLAQVDSPVTLRMGWALLFPPGTAISSWPDQVDGDLTFELASANQFTFQQFALAELAAQADIQLAAGLVSDLDLMVAGGFDLLTFNEQFSQFTLDPDRVHWSVHVDTNDFIDWTSLPLHVEAQSTGHTDIMLDARLRADVSGYMPATENTPLALQSERAQLIVRQPQLHIDDLRANDIQLELPFVLQFAADHGLRVQADRAAGLSMALSMPFDEQFIETPHVEIALSEWQWHMPSGAVADSQLSGHLDIHLASLQAPGLLPINWRWFGTFDTQPLLANPRLEANGRLTNSAGLVIRQQLDGSAEQWVVDWQLADIFWLAGNPIAATLDDLWPELLTLERGRTRATGQVHLPFGNTPLSLSADVELMDVAGVYDTASFSGVGAQLHARSDGNNFTLALDNGYVQRLQYGMTHGPGEFQLRYQGSLAAPLAGELEIGNNRLNVLNGVVSVLPARYDLSAAEHTFYVDLSQLDIARLLAEYPAADIQGSGLLSGSIPVRYSPQGVFVDSGRIAALPPGGQLQYRSERARQMAQSNMAMGIVMNALDDFHYSQLQGDVTYLEDGTLQIGLLVEGRNPNLENGRPVRLEVTLQEDLPALLASLQLTNQLNELIQQRVQQRLIQGLRN